MFSQLKTSLRLETADDNRERSINEIPATRTIASNGDMLTATADKVGNLEWLVVSLNIAIVVMGMGSAFIILVFV